MAADCLSSEETATFQTVYRRDVKYWENWHLASRMAKKQGKAAMGLTWVVLPYRPGVELALMRQQINSIYLNCLQEYAEQYGLCVGIETATNKVMLYDPAQVSIDWLNACKLPDQRLAA
jgi:hypothetical protein